MQAENGLLTVPGEMCTYTVNVESGFQGFRGSRAVGKLARTPLLSMCAAKHTQSKIHTNPQSLWVIQAGIPEGLCEGDGEQQLESETGNTGKNTPEGAGTTYNNPARTSTR